MAEPGAARQRPGHWPAELLAGLSGAAATLPLTLTLALLAFAPAGPWAAALGLPAAVGGLLLGGIVLALASRSSMPAAGASSATTLVIAGFVATLAGDPALDLSGATDRSTLLALTGACVAACGMLQALFAALRLGGLAKLVPAPVIAGFMNSVAILVLLAQAAPLLGLAHDAWARDGLGALARARGAPLALGAATAALVWVLARRFPRAPAALLALAAGALVAEAAPWLRHGLEALPRVGALPAAPPRPDALWPLWAALTDGSALLQRHGAAFAVTALLLALIGSLESLLNTLSVDDSGRARRDLNRELLALAGANLASGLFGGVPLVCQRARSVATVLAGGVSRRAALVGGATLVLMFTLARPLIERLPLAVLAGIMLTIAVALIDRWTRQLARQWLRGDRSVALRQSLLLVALVCAVTLALGFVAGVTVGVALSIGLFLRSMNRSLLRSRYTAAQRPSRRIYPPALESLLAPARAGIAVFELEGALFFGNADRLRSEAERLGPACTSLLVDLSRVSTVDTSGAVGLAQMATRLATRGVRLRLAGVDRQGRHAPVLQTMLSAGPMQAGDWFADLDQATEAAERACLAEAGLTLASLSVPLDQCRLLQDMAPALRARLAACLQPRRLAAGETLFRQGDPGDALYVLSEGSVSIHAAAQRILSLSPGMTFGEIALLDGHSRTGDAVADVDSLVYGLTRERLAQLQDEDPALAAGVHRSLAVHIAERLRAATGAWHADAGHPRPDAPAVQRAGPRSG